MRSAPRTTAHPRLVATLCVAALGLAFPAVALPLLHSDYQSYVTGPSPRLVVAGDLNGDGFDDVVVADGDGVAYFLARGDQTFEPARRFLPGIQPTQLLLLERKPRGFSRLGLVAPRADHRGVDVDVYARVDARHPSEPVVVTFAPASGNVVVADVDGDGVGDLVANDDQAQQVWIAYGRHNGSFEAPVAVPMAVANTRVAVGDIDGDGRADLIATNGGASVLARALGLGARRFGPPRRMPAAEPFDAIAVGDFNADGRADLVTGAPFFGDGVLRIYVGDANGVLVPHDTRDGDLVPQAMVVGDLDGDGRADLVLGRGPEVFLRGRNAFADPIRVAEGAVWVKDLALGDFDGDGRLDLAVVDGVALGCGIGATETPTSAASNPGMPGPPISLHVWHGRGDGTFESAPTYPVPGYGAAPLLVDLDGDGVLDLVAGFTGDAEPGLRTWRGRPDGSFVDPVDIALGERATAVAAAAFGGDGRVEIAANLGDPVGTVALLRLRADRTLEQRADSVTGCFAARMAVADLDGDGRPDLVVPDLRGRNATVLLSRPGFGHWQRVALPVRSPSDAVAAADFDGDGWIDLALAGYYPVFGSNLVRLLRGAGDGTFALVDSLVLPRAPLSVRAVDGDGDGRPDLVICASTHGCFGNDTFVRLLPNVGPFRFGAPTDEFMEAGPQDAMLADVTGDGVPDLVAVSGEGRVAVRPGQGSYRFGELSRFGLPGILPRVVLVADLDHDGRNDVVANDELGVHVLLNQGAAARPVPHARRDASNPTDGSSTAAAAGSRLSAAHNPAPRGGAIAFDLRLARAEPDVRIALYDVVGRQVAQREFGALSAGTHRLVLDAAGTAGELAPGLYFARARLDGGALHARLLVLP